MAVAIDSQESGGASHRSAGVDPPSLTYSFNNVAGNLIVVMILITASSGQTVAITAPTYGGDAMTLVPSSQQTWGGGASIIALYYKTNPKTGANNVIGGGTTTPGGAATIAIHMGAISFSGVDTAAPVGTATTGTNTSGTTATAGAITTASGNYVFSAGGWGSGTGGTAAGGATRTFVLNGSGTTAGDDSLGEYELSTGAAITASFTWTGSDNWRIVAVDILAAASAAGSTLALQFLGL